ncbi:MAG: flagellar protein export ATPase FliI [Firmicutes bacterium]|nr:flagellar protein export ATPase FliI [Bacillota bacterium]
MVPDLGRVRRELAAVSPIPVYGRVSRVVGLTVESVGPDVRLGELCYIISPKGQRVAAEVVGFQEDNVLLMPLDDMAGVSPGAKVRGTGVGLEVPVGQQLLGRVLDGLGNPIDGKGPLCLRNAYPLEASPPNPLFRQRITEPLSVGVRAIDGLLTLGKGQRIGIFAGSGVGKSTLLGMIARNTSADVNVIALIGERGREVREFIERDLGEEGLARSVVIVATSDQPALVRVKGTQVATAIAEYFRDQGCDVVLMMDSLTRFALAQREIGLAIGEPPTTRGYTPSVFALLPKLLERAGMGETGSITGLYTVLVDGDDFNEPVSDSARAILDGHIILSRDLANQNHYPAIDTLASASRVMGDVVEPRHLEAAAKVKQILATYRKAEDLVNIGAYKKGSNPLIDVALENIDAINAYLRQAVNEGCSFADSLDRLLEIAQRIQV